MKINKELIDKYEFLVIDEDTTARVVEAEGFKKLMVLYRHKQPVWAHRDCLTAKPEKPEKPKRNRLTGRKNRV